MCSFLKNMSKSLLEKLLDYYQITYDDYLYITRDLKEDSFLENHRFDDIDKAVELVKGVINNHEKIMIYGDYDADGVMGTSILVKMFKYLNIEASYFIPTRYVDGYGIFYSVLGFKYKGYFKYSIPYRILFFMYRILLFLYHLLSIIIRNKLSLILIFILIISMLTNLFE